jgi:hypothetical protein
MTERVNTNNCAGLGAFQRPAQVNQALAEALARGKAPHQDANGLGQQLAAIQLAHIGQIFQLAQVAPQLLQHHALPFGRHGAHQHFFAGEVLVERANRETGCSGHLVGGQTGLAFFVQNLSSRLEQGLHGLLRPGLRGLTTQAGWSLRLGWCLAGFGTGHEKALQKM